MLAADVAELPEIQESEIEELCTSANFKKGRALFDDEKLGELRVEGDVISAICTEKAEEVAVPEAQFRANGINKTTCTCSYSGGGLCRHRVALLLCLAHTPEKFERIEFVPEEVGEPEKKAVAVPKKKADAALFKDLCQRDSDELAQMILALVESEPKLKGALRRLMQPRLSEGEVNKVRAAVESQVKKILKAHRPNFSLVRREVKLQLRSAQSLESSRPLDAGRLYSAILDAIVGGGTDLSYCDSSNVFMGATTDCLTGLDRVFDVATSDRRIHWLGTVCSVFLLKVELGGVVDFSEAIEKILVRATPDEWLLLETRLDNFLASQSGKLRKSVVWSYSGALEVEYLDDSKWSRETIVGLKTDWMARNGRADEARSIVMEQGSPSQQVRLLLREKNFDEAIVIANDKFNRNSGLIVEFADDLLKADEWKRAKAWAVKHKMLAWLADQSVLHNESDALEHLINFFEEQSDFPTWNRVLAFIKDDQIEAVRARMWKILEKRGAYLTMFDIALPENNIAVLMTLWPKLNEVQKMWRNQQYALAIEETHPQVALKILSPTIEPLINTRSRESYREVAAILVRIRNIMNRLGLENEFSKKLLSLKSRYPMLRAFNEELTRVGL